MDARIIDLRYDGRPRTVGAWLCGDVLIDCGPGSGLPWLLEGLGDRAPRALLLTHVHLDHAGAAGALVERWPQLPVYIHPRGAPHLADPSRLVASARRVFGERLEELLGEVLPVPEAQPAHDRATASRSRALRCAWTPGHASHHVAFLEPDSGLAFCGDLAGVRLEGDVVVPPTPPPEVDLDAWRSSLQRLQQWRPARARARPLRARRASQRARRRDARGARRVTSAGRRRARRRSCRRSSPTCASACPDQAVEDYMFVALARPSAAGLRRWLERGREPNPPTRARIAASICRWRATDAREPPLQGARRAELWSISFVFAMAPGGRYRCSTEGTKAGS